MGARRTVVAVASTVLVAVGLPGLAHAGEVPDFEPLVTVTPSPVMLGGEIDAEMACEPTAEDFEGETPIPTFEMAPPGGGGVVAPDSTMGDAGTVFATWTADLVGEWGLFVTCDGNTQVFTVIVEGPEPTDPPATDPPATEPPATDPAVTTAPQPTTAATLPATGSEGGTAAVAGALVLAGVAAILVARRGRPA